jgi:hypothetical protein
MGTVLLIGAGFFVAVAIVVLVAPFTAVLKFLYSDEKKTFSASFSWLHPWVVNGEIDIEQQKVNLCFLNFIRIKQGLGFDEEEDDQSNVQADIPHDSANETAPKAPTFDSDEKTTASADVERQSRHDSSRTQEKPFEQRTARQKTSSITRLRNVWNRLKNIVEHPVVFFMHQKIWRQAMFRWLFLIAKVPAKLWPDIRLQLHVEAHIQDPATTGKVYGYWMALSHAFSLQTSRRIAVVFVPIFDRELFEAHGTIRIQTSLLRLPGPLILVCLRFPFFTTVRVWFAAKKHKKNMRAATEN